MDSLIKIDYNLGWDYNQVFESFRICLQKAIETEPRYSKRTKNLRKNIISVLAGAK